MMVEDYRTPLLGQKDIKYVSNGNHAVDIEEQEENNISRLCSNGIKKLQAFRKEDDQVVVEILPEQVEHDKELEGSFHRFKQLSSSLGKIPEIEALSPVDPFRNNTHDIEGFYGWAKLVLLFPLLIIRVVVAAILLAIGYVITKIGLAGYKRSENPMPKWRRRLVSVNRLCARGLLFCYGFQWIRRIGKPAPREVAPIVVSNHVSFIDPMFFFYELFPTIVSSQSHDDIFGVGTIVRAMQVILVDRSSAESRKMAIDEIKRRAGCNEFPRVLLFPEGTTTNGRAIISFRSGAFVPGVPIQPVVVRYPHIHFDPSWGNISLPRLLLRMLTQVHNFMEVEYLPVVFPSEREQRHPPLYSEMVRYNMARALNVPETQHNHGDLMLAVRASQLHVIIEMALIGMYGGCGMFSYLGNCNVIVWNELMAASVQNKKGENALQTFQQLLAESVEPNVVTFVHVLNACSSMMNFREGILVHSFIITSRVAPDVKLWPDETME